MYCMKVWISILSVFFSVITNAQEFPEGMPYQAQILSSSGELLNGSEVDIAFNIRMESFDGEIVWGERHVVVLNDWSHFELNIGQGVSTGMGSVPYFDEIDWSRSLYFLEMLVDEDRSGSFVSVSNQQLMAVPFAFHSKTTAQKFSLSDLNDVDTFGIQVGDVLKWDGLNWIPEEYDMPDSILFAFYSDSALFAERANFAENCAIPIWVDSSMYAIYGDSASYAANTEFAEYADSSNFSDTSSVSYYSLGNWGLNGNSDLLDENFLGTLDSTDLIFKTNEVERLRIKANGKLGFGIADPLTDVHIDNVNGLLFTGEFGVGEIPIEGAGTRMMWYPKKAAFRVGEVTGTNWDDGRIGEYSFAAGYNTRADGNYAVAFGLSSWAGGEGAFAVGEVSEARGDYSFAAGHSARARGDYSLAIGRGTYASGEGAVALGYHPTASGDYSLALGNYCTAAGIGSTVLGYRAKSLHDGTFVYNDYSDPFTFLESTNDNQFMVQAIGGFVFYTDADLLTGVELLPGAGSWSILSDSSKKENINLIDGAAYLSALNAINVYKWNYKSQADSIRHIGPMAQDFKRLFQIGVDETMINSGDFDGINLMLLKALQQELLQKEDLIKELNRLELLLEELEKQKNTMNHKLNEIEKRIAVD